jgi:hypothetical protein
LQNRTGAKRSRLESKVLPDECKSGNSEFAKDIIANADEKAKATLRLNMKHFDLPSLPVFMQRIGHEIN